MAEEFGEKTEAATPRRRQEAREEGKVARSRDLTSAVMLLSLLYLMRWFGPGVIGALRVVLARSLGSESLGQLGTTQTLVASVSMLLLVARAMAPLLAGAMIVAVGINMAQVGFMLNFERLTPNLQALNPMQGLGRIFGSGRGMANMAMSILKLILVAAVAYSAVHSRIGQILTVSQLEFLQIFGLGSEVIYAIAWRIAILLLILAMIDYIYQRFQMERDLRMSKHEVKEEMRRMEGDPKIKQRRRQIAHQLAQKRLKKDVPTADVVLTNPTEFAVALKYDAASMRAPRVVAKGQGLMAMRIREIAIEAGVPILERKPLARALYKMVEVGQEIPEEFYAAIAEILAYVYSLTGKHRQPAMVPVPA